MDPIDPFPPADPLGEALHFLRMNGAFYCRSELTAPWGLTLPPMPALRLVPRRHVGAAVARGRRRGRTACSGPVTSRSSPTARGTCSAASPARRRPAILDLERELVSDRYEILRHGGGGAPTTLICGAVRFDHPAARNLVAILPAIIHLESSGPLALGLDAGHAAAHGRRGTRAAPRGRSRDHPPRRHPGDPGDPLVDRDDPAARTGWLGALRDRQIGRAIALIHRDPARAWTRRVARRRAGDVALGVRGPLHRARRRAGDALRRPLADAGRRQRAAARSAQRSASSPTGSGIDPRPPSAAPSSASSAWRPARSDVGRRRSAQLSPPRRVAEPASDPWRKPRPDRGSVRSEPSRVRQLLACLGLSLDYRQRSRSFREARAFLVLPRRGIDRGSSGRIQRVAVGPRGDSRALAAPAIRRKPPPWGRRRGRRS